VIYTKDLMIPSQLVAVMGLPGVGKSAAAHLIAQQLDAVLLRSDVIRKELHPIPRYTPEEGQHVYQVMFEQAVDLLTRRRSVVLDATFRSAGLRRQMRQIAQNAGVLWRLVLVTAPEEVIRERLSARHNDPSDGDFETYQQLQREFETIHEPHDVIANSGTLAELAVKVDKIFRV
jgi:predicted kinase